MNPGAFFHDWRRGGGSDERGIVGPLVIAILFAIAAVISFAVDQSVTLSSPPEPPTQSTTR